jgi:hypothetical protein
LSKYESEGSTRLSVAWAERASAHLAAWRYAYRPRCPLSGRAQPVPGVATGAPRASSCLDRLGQQRRILVGYQTRLGPPGAAKSSTVRLGTRLEANAPAVAFASGKLLIVTDGGNHRILRAAHSEWLSSSAIDRMRSDIERDFENLLADLIAGAGCLDAFKDLGAAIARHGRPPTRRLAALNGH